MAELARTRSGPELAQGQGQGQDSAPAPWIGVQAQQLLAQRGHAWLLHGPSGLGQYELALTLARAWLCEKRHDTALAGTASASAAGRIENALRLGCGHCASCHAIDVRTHADLCVLMPETRMIELAWPLHEKAQSDIDDKKRKASKEIRVEAMRDAIEFTQRTRARAAGKVVLVFPAERMNLITANALLKTLEEPPGEVRFVLATEAAHQLLPTIRSRCLSHSMQWPAAETAAVWLQQRGVPLAETDALLKAAGGRPQDALDYAQSGRAARSWQGLPKAMARGDVAYAKEWSAPQLIDALHKLCHDLLAQAVGAAPRFYALQDLPATPSVLALTDWSRELKQSTRSMEHPFNPGLMQEALVLIAKKALKTP